MRYLDKYPNCIGCPISKYYDTMISFTIPCHSCDEPSVEETDASTVK